MAIKANIVMDQGASFSTTINVTDSTDSPINLTGYTGASMMRKHYSSTNAYSFSVSVTPLTGIVALSMTANQTALIPSGRYVYDCEMTDSNGTVSRILEGIVTVTPGVTR